MESVCLIISNNVHFQLPRRVIRAYENQTLFFLLHTSWTAILSQGSLYIAWLYKYTLDFLELQ